MTRPVKYVYKTAVLLCALMLLEVCLCACRGASLAPSETEQNTTLPAASDPAVPEKTAENGETMIYAHIGDRALTILPENNSSAAAFIDLLKKGDLTVNMHDYGGFEKVGALGASLPANDEHITTAPGDVILYQGNQITIYYGVNTWNFTRLGKVQNLTQPELIAALGKGDPTVVFSVKE